MGVSDLFCFKTLSGDFMNDLDTKTCPNCKKAQFWDPIYGFANRYCPDLCTQVPLPWQYPEATEKPKRIEEI